MSGTKLSAADVNGADVNGTGVNGAEASGSHGRGSQAGGPDAGGRAGADAGARGDEAGSGAGVIYEVNLDLDAAIADEYRAWLREHIAQICALPGFLGADLHAVTDPAPAPGRSALSVRYRLRDAAALDDYLREHAPRLRAEGTARFGGRFNASRRVLQAERGG